MQVTLRQTIADDAPLLAELCLAVHEIHVAAQPDFFKPLRPDDPQLIAFYANAITQGDIIYIAEAEGKAVGYMKCEIVMRVENVFTYAQSRLHIDQMSVNEAYRSQGIGKLLMDKAFEIAQEHGVQRVTLSVWAFNEQAQHFYTTNGFEYAYYIMWTTSSAP